MAVPVLLFALSGSIALYQCYWHPLARLQRQLSPGETWDAALQRFDDYVDRHGRDSGLQYVKSDSLVGHAGLAPPGASRSLFIYQLSMADDLQLTAWFDASGRLISTDYLCD